MPGLSRPISGRDTQFKGVKGLIEVDKINVSYGRVQVLWRLSFKVEKRGITALIGPNGAGKTTTVLTIAGLLHPTSGAIRFLGKRIDRWPPYRVVDSGIALIPERRELFPRMTVLENLLLGAYTKRAREKLDDTLEWVYQVFPILKEREKQLAGTLSGGEQQMLAIGRGLMSRPSTLMLDEPSLGLAPMLVLKIFNVIQGLRDEGLTILLVEQNVYHALRMAEKGYILERGKVVLEGGGRELLENEYVKKAYLGV
jgi:branched-chain amino acid transport system ATP-binding protein